MGGACRMHERERENVVFEKHEGKSSLGRRRLIMVAA
jgi:hypothetical protein